MGIWGGKMHAFGSAPRLEIRGKGVYPPPEGQKEKIQWGCCPEMSTLLVTSMRQTIFCALAKRVFASAPGSQSPEYNIPVVICCYCLFVHVSSVLLLELATAILLRLAGTAIARGLRCSFSCAD